MGFLKYLRITKIEKKNKSDKKKHAKSVDDTTPKKISSKQARLNRYLAELDAQEVDHTADPTMEPTSVRVKDEGIIIEVNPRPGYRIKPAGDDVIVKTATYKVKPSLTTQPSFRNNNNNNGFDDSKSLSSKNSSGTKSTAQSTTVTKKPNKSNKKFSRPAARPYKVKPVTDIPSEIIKKGASATKCIEAFMEELNHITTAESIATFFTDDAFFIPEDVDKIPMAIFKDILVMIHASLPDMGFDYENIKQEGDLVIVEGSQFSGSHIGEPYSPLPGKLPAIPAEGTYVLVDKERWFFEMEGDKIKSWTLVALGSCTGPMGIYELVGGVVPK